MKHRIVILGAGYAGAGAAGYLARHLSREDFEITVVNAADDFVQRIRLHQVAVGREPDRIGLAELFAGTGIRLRIAAVTAVDPERRTVTVAGNEELGYDTLLYTLGSGVADGGVPGVAEHTFHVASRPAARRLADRLAELDAGARVVVVGGNLTGIETATQIAETRPDLRVSLATRGEVGGWLAPAARRHLLAAFTRLGIELHEHAMIDRVDAISVATGTGTVLASDATVWAAGFAVPEIAAAAGLDVADDGRIVVDDAMRSVSHPHVYAAGDAVRAIGSNGEPLYMSCASAGFTRMRAAAAILRELTGARSMPTPLAYVGNCISLGDDDGLFQLVDGAGRSTRSVRGAAAARAKRFVYRGTVWNQLHPTYGLPTRRRGAAGIGARSETANA